jgi:hypothetical protein
MECAMPVDISRRWFLLGGAAAVAAVTLPKAALALEPITRVIAQPEPQALRLYERILLLPDQGVVVANVFRAGQQILQLSAAAGGVGGYVPISLADRPIFLPSHPLVLEVKNVRGGNAGDGIIDMVFEEEGLNIFCERIRFKNGRIVDRTLETMFDNHADYLNRHALLAAQAQQEEEEWEDTS